MRIQHPHNGHSDDASKSASISRSIALPSSQVGSFHLPSIRPILTRGFFDGCAAESGTRRKINWYAPSSGSCIPGGQDDESQNADPPPFASMMPNLEQSCNLEFQFRNCTILRVAIQQKFHSDVDVLVLHLHEAEVLLGLHLAARRELRDRAACAMLRLCCGSFHFGLYLTMS